MTIFLTAAASDEQQEQAKAAAIEQARREFFGDGIPAFRIASAAVEVSTPDSEESAGGLLISSIGREVLERAADLDGEALEMGFEGMAADDLLSEVADEAPSIWTLTRSEEFNDLQGGLEYEELSGMGFDLSDGTFKIEGAALYLIGRRAAAPVFEAIAVAYAEQLGAILDAEPETVEA